MTCSIGISRLKSLATGDQQPSQALSWSGGSATLTEHSAWSRGGETYERYDSVSKGAYFSVQVGKPFQVAFPWVAVEASADHE